jgi:hypothetical protein
MDALGLVATLVHAATLVAERQRARIAIRNEQGDPLDPRPKRLVDPGEERVDTLSRQRGDRDGRSSGRPGSSVLPPPPADRSC